MKDPEAPWNGQAYTTLAGASQAVPPRANSGIRIAPSSREYSVWTWRCANGSGIPTIRRRAGRHSNARIRSKSRSPPVYLYGMRLTVHVLRTRAEGTPEEIRAIDRFLRIRHPKAAFMPSIRRGWDGYVRFFRRGPDTFPSGLLDRVAAQFRPEILDQRSPIGSLADPPHSAMLSGVVLRDYQIRAIETALDRRSGVLGLAVSAGKTEIALAIAKAIGKPSLYVVHRRDLLHQVRERAELRLGGRIPVGLVGDGLMDFSIWGRGPGLVIATVQTLIRLLVENPTILHGPDLLIMDECHATASAASWSKVALACPAAYRFGLSGTPATGDPIKDWTIEGAIGPVIASIRSADLIERGISVRPRVVFLRIRNPPSPMSWDAARRILIEGNEARNVEIVDAAARAAEAGRRVLILCNTRRHVGSIRDLAERCEVRLAIATGLHGSPHRARILADLRRGLAPIVLATIFDVGQDLPELDLLIMAGSGKSSIRVLQRIGRVLRSAPGKKTAHVLDFLDEGNRYVERHARARIKVCESEGFSVQVLDILPTDSYDSTPEKAEP